MLRETLHVVRPTLSYGESSNEGQNMHGLQVGAQVSCLSPSSGVTLYIS